MVASFAPEIRSALGLERAAHHIVRPGLAGDFSECANPACGPGRPGCRRKHPETGIEIPGGRRSAHAKPGRSQLLPGTCRILSARRPTTHQFIELPPASI